jgi:hypothetical protein
LPKLRKIANDEIKNAGCWRLDLVGLQGREDRYRRN